MKFPLLLSAASLAAGLVLPDEKTLTTFTTEETIFEVYHLQQSQPQYDHLPDIDSGNLHPSWYATTVAHGIERYAAELGLEGNTNALVEGSVRPGDHEKLKHRCHQSKKRHKPGRNAPLGADGEPHHRHHEDDIDQFFINEHHLYGQGSPHSRHGPKGEESPKDFARPPGFLEKLKDELSDIFDRPDHPPLRPPPYHDTPPFGDEPPEEEGGKPHHSREEKPDGHHKKATKTLYELISESEYTTIFTKILNEFDEAVKYLNSTEANYTVFVPIDKAFKKFKHYPEPPREYVEKWLKYHVSPEVYNRRTFLSAQTVPTYLKEENDSPGPQRISTQAGLKGLSLNFYVHVIKSDIYATNGVIHALDGFLVPPFSATVTIDIVPSLVSTLNLGLIKTGLADLLDPEILKSGGTLFAPTNHAFAKLGPHINAFLFSRFGHKYLRALLKYHLVANHTLFSDAYYGPSTGNESAVADGRHVDLPTLLHGRSLRIDIHHFHRFSHIVINKHVKVAVSNIPVKEGVIHLVPSVIIPPRDSSDNNQAEKDVPLREPEGHHKGPKLTVEDLIDRLEPFVEDE